MRARGLLCCVNAAWRKMGPDMQIAFGEVSACLILTNGLKGCVGAAAARQNEGVAPSIHQEEVLHAAAAAVEAARALDTLNELFGNDNGLPRGHHQSPLSQYPSELHTVLTLAPHISSPQVQDAHAETAAKIFTSSTLGIFTIKREWGK